MRQNVGMNPSDKINKLRAEAGTSSGKGDILGMLPQASGGLGPPDLSFLRGQAHNGGYSYILASNSRPAQDLISWYLMQSAKFSSFLA